MKLDWLERAYCERSYGLIYIEVDPALDPLRAHPRFARLLRAVVGLPVGGEVKSGGGAGA